MIIGNNNIGEIKYFMTLNNSIYLLNTIENQNDLGVIIDTKLSFDDYINKAVNKATKMTKIIVDNPISFTADVQLIASYNWQV